MTDLLDALIEETPAKRWIRRHLDHQDKEFCVIWPFSRAQNGYPQVGKAKVTVTRIMCEHRHGPAPTPGHQAAHSCNNGHNGCANLWHLDWKTPAENQLDRGDKGIRRQRKLTLEQVDEIRAVRGRERTVDTAERFGVTEANIRQIQSGKTWRQDNKPKRALTVAEVQTIRATPWKEKSAKQFAEELGVTVTVVQRVRDRGSYVWVPEPASQQHSVQGE